MDAKELPGWVRGERVKILHVICEARLLHAAVPFDDAQPRRKLCNICCRLPA